MNAAQVECDRYVRECESFFAEGTTYIDTKWLSSCHTAYPSGNRLSAGVNGGYDFGFRGLSIGPIVGIRYTKVNINSYIKQIATLSKMATSSM